MWRKAFDQVGDDKKSSFDIANEVEAIYTKILPFYTQLHAYFRRQFAAIYKEDEYLERDTPIPAHLLSKPMDCI
jgi:hypothetical protein